MKTIQKTHYQQVKDRQAEALKLLLQLTDQTMDDHTLRMFNFGNDLLEKYFVKSERTERIKFKMLTDEKLRYWSWVENLLAQEDEYFWHKYRMDFYEDLHDAPLGSKFAFAQVKKYWEANTMQLLRSPAIHERVRNFVRDHEKQLLR